MAKKSLAEIAMSYGYVYVAQVAMGANMKQTLDAICEAEAYHGPSLIIGYAPCEMHCIKGGMTNCQKEMKRAVDCGYWNLFRFNPAKKAEGKNPFTLDSKAPAGGYQEFLMNEARYSSLTRELPGARQGALRQERRDRQGPLRASAQAQGALRGQRGLILNPISVFTPRVPAKAGTRGFLFCAKPSQSPAVTALPKGEPRGCTLPA